MSSYPPGGRPQVPPGGASGGKDRHDNGRADHRPRRSYGHRQAKRPGAAEARRDTARRAGLPRRTAYDVLAAVHDREAYANLLLPRLLAERGLAGRDAALATELAYGTLRGLGTYDAVLAACSDRPLDKLDPPVLHVLRLGTHQLLATRVGAHAAVATSVDLAKAVAGPRVSGYVNAVLRRVATRDLDAWLTIVAPDPETDPDGYLAVRHSHPRWIVAAYRAALGDAADTELEAALAAGNARPRVTLATFPGGPSRDEVMPGDAEPGRWSPYAFTLTGGDPAALVESGLAAVQDEASQLAALALARVPATPAHPPTPAPAAAEPDRATPAPATPAPATPAPAAAEPDPRGAPHGAACWLDACAGPGGKARLLYGLAAQASARLVAADIHPHRAALVSEALARASRPGPAPAPAPVPGSAATRHGQAPERARAAAPQPAATQPAVTGPAAGYGVLVADGRRPPWRDGAFDKVLVDVPCSGLGALRRRPEARWRKREEDIDALAALQRELLGSALRAVRPGGVVAYVTCSPVPAETRDVVTAVVSATDGVEVLDAPAVLSDVPGVRSPSPLFAQLWPHRHGSDAIFVALLRRTAQ